MKTFYSAEDIENFAEQGQHEIRVDDNVVLTDLAKQTAHLLGIRIREISSSPLPSTVTSPRPQPVRQSPALSGKPKGCQRRPENKPTPVSRATTGQSRPVVDRLVEKIKRISDQSV